MQIPQQLIDSLKDVEGFDREAFLKVHADQEQITSIRVNPLKPFIPGNPPHTQVPWSRYGFYLDQRPSFTFDPSFHAGCYYVQEASSMFLEQALMQTMDITEPLRVLDLSAAPGGKSTHIQSIITADSLLVSNDVIKSRANILKDNIVKWGGGNVVVTNNDPRDFARLPEFFDVMVVDAPCSGSGLFRRDPDAIGEWSLHNVALCSQRQQRILADILPALRPGGIMIYSTCSFSKEEDEDIINWLIKEHQMTTLPIQIDPSWGIITSNEMGYRFWPDKTKGEGFFLACFQKPGEPEVIKHRIRTNPEPLSKQESDIVSNWIENLQWKLIKNKQTVYAWPEKLADDYNILLNHLRVIYSGTIVGELMRDKLIPDHSLAMSGFVNRSIAITELNFESAIEYLQRKDLKIETVQKGWQLVSFSGNPLGWINALPNRINNYYPKELRILKDKPNP